MSLFTLRVLRAHTPTASSSALLTSSTSSTSSALPSFTSSFSTSSSSQESKSRRKSRLTRKTHIERKATLTRSQELSRPDPILGYAEGKAEVWEKSQLKSLLLDRKNVWGEVVKTGEAGAAGVGAAAGGEVVKALEAGEYVPQNYNFGLKGEDITLLREVLPSVAAQRTLFDKLNNEQLMGVRASESLQAEEEKRDRLVRIMDLRNASSKGIHVENTRRIVDAFGSKAGDTGRPEVQAAILTSRIHSLTDHLLSSPRDIHNRRPLRALIQQRAKVLKYLQSINVSRYEACLVQIGVEARAVQGEVIVTKAEMRTLIKGA